MGGYPNMVPGFRSRTTSWQLRRVSRLNLTPASRGITSWAPGIAAGYAPASGLALNVNSVNGWPTHAASFPAVLVTACAARCSRPPAGDRLNGNESTAGPRSA